MGTAAPVETAPDTGNGNTPWAAAMSVGRPPHPQVLCIAVAATVIPRALSPGRSTSSTVLISTRLFFTQLHCTSARAGIYEEEKFEVLNHSSLFEVTLSARTF